MATLELHFEISRSLLDDRGQRVGFVLLGAFLASFLFIRTSARLIRSPKVTWWPGSVKTKGGLHLHHLVWGIVLVLVSGFLNFVLRPASPGAEILAAVFGIGAGLTLDEFALWVRLEDVYWAEEGRASLDAVVVAALIGGMVVLGIAPFGLPHRSATIDSLVLVTVIDVLLASVAILKGRLLLGLIGIFVPLFSIAGALRLAAPGSPWAHWRYAAGSSKMRRSQDRFDRSERRRRRLADAIAGAPSSATGSSAFERRRPS
jgi:hypothetical protein